MARNPDKRKCIEEGCNAWAIRDSQPPRCSPHSGKVGAPEGNRNRLTHGFYATAVLPEELDDLGEETVDSTLADEIAITRVALRRILRMLLTGQSPGPDPRPLDAADYARISALAFRGAGAISRLLRAHHDLGGQHIDRRTMNIARWLQKHFDDNPDWLRKQFTGPAGAESEAREE
jgi:hypothetical protein